MPVTLLPWMLGAAGTVYAAAAATLGAMFLLGAWRVYTLREGAPADRAARKLFSFSIWYLFLLFAVLLLEQGIWPLVSRGLGL